MSGIMLVYISGTPPKKYPTFPFDPSAHDPTKQPSVSTSTGTFNSFTWSNHDGSTVVDVRPPKLWKDGSLNWEKILLTHRIHVWYIIFTYIYHRNQPNVGKYTIHGSYGLSSWAQSHQLEVGWYNST